MGNDTLYSDVMRTVTKHESMTLTPPMSPGPDALRTKVGREEIGTGFEAIVMWGLV